MTTEIVPAGGKIRVMCVGECSRPLDRIVESSAHAVNLAAKHEREFHADSQGDRETLIALLKSTQAARDGWHGVPAVADAILAAGFVRPPC